MNRSTLLPVLGYAGYPLAIAGGLLIFGTCSLLTLNMITANLGQVTSPVAASPDFNVPPVEQIGSLVPPPAAVSAEPVTPAEPESSIVAVAPPQQTFTFDIAPADGTVAPTDSSFDVVEPPGLGSGMIGSQAVNVRGGPSRTGVVLGVLNAGSAVRVGENVGGWVHVYFEGGDGWVYESYLAGG